MTDPIIRLSGIDKFYGDFQALYDINAEIQTGEFFSLLGPSGCGKTTLLRTIAGFEEISKGEPTSSNEISTSTPVKKEVETPKTTTRFTTTTIF